MGSTGNRQGGGRKVYKGKHMPGRLGGKRVTTSSVQVDIFFIRCIKSMLKEA